MREYAMREYRLGRVAGLDLTAIPLAIVGSIVLLAVLSGIAIAVLHMPIGQAIAGGLIAVVLHWVSDIVHHLGHAWAARRTGYPMTGIRLGTLGLLGTSLYPPNEPALPAAIHIRRALGGPAGSLLFTLVAAVAALILRNVSSMFWWVGVFFFMDNLLIFTLGAFLPLGFTDGSTLLHWWGK